MEDFLQFLVATQEQLQNQQDQLQSQRNKVVQNQQQTEESANKYFDKVVKLVKQRESNVIKQIKTCYNQSIKMIEEQNHILQSILEQVQKISEQILGNNLEGIDQNQLKDQINFQKSLPSTPIPLYDFQFKDFQNNQIQSYLNDIGDVVLKYQLTMSFDVTSVNKPNTGENGSCEHAPSKQYFIQFHVMKIQMLREKISLQQMS